MDFLSLTQSEPSIESLDIQFNPDGWGPTACDRLDVFGDVPYTHFDKKDKLGRHADFVMAAMPSYQQKSSHYQKRRDDFYQNNDFSFKHDVAEDSTFQLVDTAKTQSKSKQQYGRNTQRNVGQQQNNRYGQQGAGGRTGPGGSARNTGARTGGQTAGGRGGRTNNRRMDRKQDRVPSLAVGGDWEMLEEFDLAQMLKLQTNPPKVQDLEVHGHLDQYDDNFDKLTTRTAKVLRRADNKVFFDVTTVDDPVLERLAVEQAGDVYATDTILAQLMAAPRSVYSWDIVIEKVQGQVFLDKRADSSLDLLTVAESAHEPPSAGDDTDAVNHPDKLSLEATMINQSFSQQVLMEVEGVRKTFEPNPFAEDLEPGMEPASVAYKYRLFTLGNIRLVARCDVNCWVKKKDEEQLVSCHALHEWDSRLCGGVQWRQKIDSQRGMVLATELKNNSARLARWTAQALLGGADQMKLGYVSRVTPTNNCEHVILATQFFKPKDFATQINLNLNNVWGIVKMICELLLNKPDGKFVLMKDPNKPIVRLYSVPVGTFDVDSEEEGGDGASQGEGRGSEDDEDEE